MSDAIQFAFLGLGLTVVYALLAQGIVLIYRGSGVLNFAHGAVALLGGYTYYEFHQRGIPFIPATLIAMALCALIGALMHQLIMRQLKQASPLTRVIATLGVLIVIQAGATLHYTDSALIVASSLPQGLVHIGQGAFPQDRLWLFGIALVLTAGLWAGGNLLRVGLATTAVAENELALATLGWSPDLLATINWALGGALAGLAGVLVVPLTGLQVTTVTLLVIPAMAAALVGRFVSFPLTLVGALVIGIAESELTRWVNAPGWPQAVPLFAIVVVLVIRGRGLPLRSHVIERLPNLGSGRISWRIVVPLVTVFGLLCATVFGGEVLAVVTSSMGVGAILLSVVVLTGYAGQLSLAQYAIAGVGALFAGRLVAAHTLPFELAALVGIVGAMAVGLVFAIPAMRTRGVNLAVVTLGLGVSIQAVVFNNGSYTGGGLSGGTMVGPQSVFGISIDPIGRPAAYAIFALISFTVVAISVCNMRRGRAGRRLIAVRTNERAAAALGISVVEAKLYAFALASAIAGVGGILLAFAGYNIDFTQFDPFGSITAVTLAVVGGVGYVIGPLFGSTLSAGGVGSLVTSHVNVASEWLTLVGGLILILLCMQDPNGMASANIAMLRKAMGRVGRGQDAAGVPDIPDAAIVRIDQATLTVEGLSVRFGGVVAVNDVSLGVKTGEVVGLIGPNGAGKTTLIDAITGFVRPSQGTIALDSQRIERMPTHRRARVGISRSFQSLELFDDLSVMDNLRAAADPRDLRSYVLDVVAPRNPPLPTAMAAAVREFDLMRDLERQPRELPYGRRRLVAIARAVATRPKILLLDEPAAGLDDTETLELGRLLRRLAEEWGLGVLLVEHDMAVVMSICDRIVALDFGRKIAEGTPEEIRRNPGVVAAYLGTPEAGPELTPSGPRAGPVD